MTKANVCPSDDWDSDFLQRLRQPSPELVRDVDEMLDAIGRARSRSPCRPSSTASVKHLARVVGVRVEDWSI